MGSAHRASDCKAYSMARFRPISARMEVLNRGKKTASLCHKIQFQMASHCHPETPVVTDGVRRVVMSRDTLSAATTLCAEKRGQGVGDVIGIFMLKLPPDLTLGFCSDSQSP